MISVLGPLQVVRDGELVDMGSPRHREVLAALVVDAGRVVPTETPVSYTHLTLPTILRV